MKLDSFFEERTSHRTHELLVPDYDIEMKNDYWSRNESDYDSTSFVEGEIIGMDTYHEGDIPDVCPICGAKHERFFEVE